MAGITDQHEWQGFNSFLKTTLFPGDTVWATVTTSVQDKRFHPESSSDKLAAGLLQIHE